MTVAAAWCRRANAILRFARPRSAGVKVTRATHVYIVRGDGARSRGDWGAAANAYGAAVAREPALAHIWIQLGHAEKERGNPEKAVHAYLCATEFQPDDAEPWLHLGHLAKSHSALAEAARHFIAARDRDPASIEAELELVRLLPACDGELWRAALRTLGIDPDDVRTFEAPALDAEAVLVDVTDLLAHFARSRLPTGIQRVQIELALACLALAPKDRVTLCCHSSARRGWTALAPDEFSALCHAGREGDADDDPRWTARLRAVHRALALSSTLVFPPSCLLINLGTSWASRDYLCDVRAERARSRLRYVPFVFDLIPLLFPGWFIPSLVADFRRWHGDVLASADGFLAISDATRTDLLVSASARRGALDANVAVVRLDGNFRAHRPSRREALARYGLTERPFVLLVSTIEPRKNHLGAFDAWRILAQTLGEDRLPRLFCVGGRGWLNDAVHDRLRDDAFVRRNVLMLSGVGDAELAALYETCLFALYPSFYEGWGLPVSEALCYGKVPATSRTSALPEAGGRFAHYFDPHDPEDIARAVRALLDDGIRTRAEAAIGEAYVPRDWTEVARAMLHDARSIAPAKPDALSRSACQ